MPRIHEGSRRKRGIFTLSTPFESDLSFRDEPSAPHGFGAAAPPAEELNHVTTHQAAAADGPALHVLPSRRDMEIKVQESEGGGMIMSQLTLEPTQFYSGAIDAGDNMADDSMNRTDEDQDHDMVRVEQEVEGQVNEREDDSVTTMGASVDLLSPEKSPRDDLLRARNGITPPKPEFQQTLPELSPATQMLDRLDAFGSQRGGAVLSRALARKSAEEEGERSPPEQAVAEKQKEVVDEDDGPQRGGDEILDGTKHYDDEICNNKEEESPTKLLASISASLAKKQTLHSLKEYFMSTQNSSSFARRVKSSDEYPSPPKVSFCTSCNNSTSTSSLPHHALCPFHPDFCNSGSYEILNLIVDGNRMGCEACVFHFEEGRPNRALGHMVGCERGKGKGTKKKNSSSCGEEHSALLGSSRKQYKGTTEEIRAHDGQDDTMKERLNVARDAAGLSKRKENGPCQSFDVGTVVFVESRTKSGENKPGGVARVTRVHLPDDDSSTDGAKYDVSYVIEKRQEKMVEQRFVSLYTDYVSPSKGRSGGLPDEKLDSSDSEEEHTKEDNAMEIASAEKVDEDGNPLSDYELLRLRNIKRNEARLAKLGLIDPEKAKKDKPKPKTKSSHHLDAEVSLEDAAASGCKTSLKSSVSLKDSAASGCNKCQQELVTGVKEGGKKHDDRCPRKRAKHADKDTRRASLEDAASTGCKKCQQELATGVKRPKEMHDNSCPRKIRQGGKTMKTAHHHQTVAILKRSHDAIDDTEKPKMKKKQSLDGFASARGGSSRIVDQLPKQKAPDTMTDRTPPPEVKCKDTPKPMAPNVGRSVTPSPALFASRIQQPLPSFITDFASQSANKDEVPAPPGSKWLPCPNPWGKIGQEDGDVVIVSPFQSEDVCDILSTFHQGPHGGLPKRFAFNPMAQNSPYLATHKSPARGGYSVLRLKRDRAGMIPWGFTVRIHEFGGACLVDNIELLSPADNAQDISGWEDSNSSAGSASGLKVHDMIISINGTTVGGMTEPEFQLELDICGPDVMLVVCRFDISEEVLDQIGSTSTSNNALGDIAMDWNDIGAVAPLEQKRISFGGDDTQGDDEYASTSNQPVIHPGKDQQKVSCHVVHSKERDLDESKSKVVLHSDDKLKSNSSLKSHLHYVKNNKKSSTHNYNGVSFDKSHGNYKACVQVEKKHSYLGRYVLAADAAHAHDECVRQLRLSTSINFSSLTEYNSARKEESKERNVNVPSSEIQSYLTSKVNNVVSAEDTPKLKVPTTAQSKISTNTPKRSTSTRVKESEAVSKYRRQVLDEFSDESEEEERLSFGARNASFKQGDGGAGLCTEVGSQEEEVAKESEDEDDENPWLGCVCGRTHPHPITVFWLQCETCDAWYNVAEECVGFNQAGAEKLDDWHCWSCSPPVAGLEK